MKSIYSLFQIFGLALLIGSCQDSERIDNRTIFVGEAVASPVELKASDYFSKICYIALETSDNCLIGNISNLQLIDDFILISTEQKQCFLFDKATGKFHYQIGHLGNDPGGYSNADPIVDPHNHRLLFHGWGNNLVCYDLAGNYMDKIEIPSAAGSYPNKYICSGKDTIIGYYQNMLGVDPERLFYIKESGDSIALLPNERTCPTFDINSISVYKGESAVKEFGPSALQGLLYMEGQDPETANVIYPSSSPFWNVGDNTYFKESFNDTIFQISGTTLTPWLIFNSGEMKWEYKDRFRKDKSAGIFIPYIFGNENLLFFYVITDLYNKEKLTTYNAIFDRVSGIARVSPYEKGITDDMNGFLPLQPVTISQSRECGGFLSPEDILTWFEDHPGKINSEQIESLRMIKGDQNPVVVIMSTN